MNPKTSKNRLFSAFLALAIVLALLPVTAFAAGTQHTCRKCSVCGKVFVLGEDSAHTYDFEGGWYCHNKSVDDQGGYVGYKTCDGSGKDGCPYGGPGENGHAPAHTHCWADSWSTDAANHWRVCTAAGCDGTKKDEASHAWDSGKVTTAATFEAAGIKTYACTVCGRTRTEAIPQLTHTYSVEWSGDANTHWHACADAGYTSLKKDEAAHTWNSGEVTAAATYEAAGTKTYTCTVCGRTRTEAIPELTHIYSSEWSGDSGAHWHACKDAGYTSLKKDEAAHTWNAGEVTAAATYEAAGTKTYTCTICGRTRTEAIPKLVADIVSSATSLGIRLSELNPDCDAKDAWKMVTPIDLSKNAEYEYPLIASGTYIIGKVTITVNDGMLTVSAETEKWVSMTSPAVMFANNAAELTGFDTAGRTVYDFDTEISIADDLNGAGKVIMQLACPVVIDGQLMDCEWYNFNSSEYAEFIEGLKGIIG